MPMKSLCLSTLVVVLLGLLIQTWVESEAIGGMASTSEQSVINGLRTRVVWVQDMGDGRDVDTHGQQFTVDGFGYG